MCPDGAQPTEQLYGHSQTGERQTAAVAARRTTAAVGTTTTTNRRSDRGGPSSAECCAGRRRSPYPLVVCPFPDGGDRTSSKGCALFETSASASSKPPACPSSSLLAPVSSRKLVDSLTVLGHPTPLNDLAVLLPCGCLQVAAGYSHTVGLTVDGQVRESARWRPEAPRSVLDRTSASANRLTFCC